jgi:prephenate dehydrogenase
MRSIAIAGVGLIGGSLGLALRKAGFSGPILGVSSPRTLEQAVGRGAIDRGVTLSEAADEADVIYLAQPISVIFDTLRTLAPMLRRDCLVTDAGSTKQQIVALAVELGYGDRFLGGHPMAGKEVSGVAAADADLFRGRHYVFTPCSTADSLPPLASDFVSWGSLFGAIPVMLDPAEHDRIVAYTSHLPQLLSTALASVIGIEFPVEQQLTISGPALRDLTRLGLSSWPIWQDIVGTNTRFISHALQVYIDKLTEMRENLQTQGLGDDFVRASETARKIRR